MRRDSLFYRLFQQSPNLLFEFLESSPANASTYRFDSVAVKEPKFEIDGVFLPPESDQPGTVYFCEVQFQKDEQLYERLFGESFLYFYRQRQRFDDWQAVVIYPSRSVEQSSVQPYRVLLNSDQVHRIYLNELGQPQELPLSIGLMVLTTVPERQAPQQARALLHRTQQEVAESVNQKAIIDLITTIMVYRFTQMSRQEVRAMLGLDMTQLKDTQFYQEVKEEGLEQGLQQGLAKARALVIRQLNRKVGNLSDTVLSDIQQLSLVQLEDLGEALLDFDTLTDLTGWLEQLAAMSAEAVRLLAQKFGALEEFMLSQIKALSLEQLDSLEKEIEQLAEVNGLVDWLDTQSERM
ncbi:MAG: Rpn family recombination-promoting nuclease/putative transposase [Phormidesmis sp. RL_2_1]|nr:Rpn family recombination-promoting nuclease/putative transposase [Phormidesmis sp. RL_2_1]